MHILATFFFTLLLVVLLADQYAALHDNVKTSVRKRDSSDEKPPVGIGAPHSAYVALSADIAIALHDKKLNETQVQDKFEYVWYETCQSLLNPTQVDGRVWGYQHSNINNDKTKQEGKAYVYVFDVFCWQLAPPPDPSKPDQPGKAVTDYADKTITYLGWTKQSAEAQSPKTEAALQQYLKGGGRDGGGHTDPFGTPSGYTLQNVYDTLGVHDVIYFFQTHASLDTLEVSTRAYWQSQCTFYFSQQGSGKDAMNVWAPFSIDKAATESVRKGTSKPYIVLAGKAGCFQSTDPYPTLGAPRQDVTTAFAKSIGWDRQSAFKQASNVEGDFDYWLKYNNTQAPPASSSEKHHNPDGSISYNLAGFPTKRVYLAMLDDDIVKVQEGTETLTYNVERQRAGWADACRYYCDQTGLTGFYYFYLQYNKEATDAIKLTKWPYFIIAADGNCFLTESEYPTPGKAIKDLTDVVTKDLGCTHDNAFSFISDMEKAYSAYANKMKNGNANLPPPSSTKGNSTSKTPPAPSSSTSGKGGGKTPSTSLGKKGKGSNKTTK